jgi:pimeloyl-ACP methyl ester carboxylesterase
MQKEHMNPNERRRRSFPCFGAMIVCTFLPACAHEPRAQLNERVLIDVEDTTLYAELRGKDERAPLLLYLHGGPGSPLGVPIFRAYGGRLLEDQFIVVYLHQRGIMKSPRVSDSSHRVNKYVDDVHHVVGYLRQRFPGREVSLLGHSWGGVLAYLYLSGHQDRIHKLVTVSAPVHVESMTRGRVAMILQWARDTGNDEAIRDLSPLEDRSVLDDLEEFRILERWSPLAYGGWARNLSRARVEAAVDYEDSFSVWLSEQEHIEELLLMELLRLDLRDEIEKINIPSLCIVGREDVDVPWYLVQEEVKNYGGHVEFRVFEHSHHMPFIDEEVLFVETVVQFLSSE